MFFFMFAVGCLAIDTQHFIVHPTDQTAAFGEYVNFECRVSSCNHTLTFLVNGKGLGHLNISAADSKVYFRESETLCEQDQYVKTLSIVVNNKTLEVVEYISCNLTIFANGALHDIPSNRAYIVNITNPYLLLPTCPHCPAATECANRIDSIHNTAHKEQQLLLPQNLIMIAYILSFIRLF